MLPGLAGVGKSSRSVVGAKYGRPVRGSFGCGAVRPAGFEDVRRCTRRDGAGKRGNQRPLSSTWRSGWSAGRGSTTVFTAIKHPVFAYAMPRRLRVAALGRKNYHFVVSDAGGERIAAI